MQPDTLERIKKLVRHIFEQHEVKHFMLGWFGGEPLMYFDEIVHPLSQYVKQLAAEYGAGFSNSMTSNGFLLTQSVRAKCPEINLNHFQITLDGDREAHNRTRNQKGMPSFDQILDNAVALVEAYPESSIKLRVNYNSDTIQADFAQILDGIPQDVRSRFWVQFQRIWQTYEKEGSDTRVKETLQHHFDALKKAAIDYYNIAPETQRRNVRNLLQKIGWKLDDAFEKHYSLANEIIEWYEKGIGYVYEILDLSFRYSIDYDFDPEAANLNIFYFKPHKVHHLAYWYSVFSMKQDCFEESLLTPKTGKELYDFLLDIENRQDIFDEKKRESVLDTVRMALKSMRPFVESRNWLDMTSNEQ